MTKIAVLAVQGAFIEHEKRLGMLGCETKELRQLKDLDGRFDGLVLPGGESTVQAKLLHELEMFEPLKVMIEDGLPVLGTCAGLILLADNIEGDGINDCEGFATLPVTVKRNAYGRQLGSFHADAVLSGRGRRGTIPATFIRAPKIVEMEEGVECIARLGGTPVAVEYGNQIGCAFHPELDASDEIYNRFLRNCR